MRILIVTPAGLGTRVGNRITALRMAGLLRGQGHQVKLRVAHDEVGADVMFALHAGKSAAAVEWAARHSPPIPTALVLTGTDIYGDGTGLSPTVIGSLELATRLIILQPRAMQEVPERFRGKTTLILQSARARRAHCPGGTDPFDVCVLANLRAVKDPLLAARAARRLPQDSKVRVRLIGEALDPSSRSTVEREARENPRFEWLGPLSYGDSQRLLAASQVLVMSSLAEGGPAVVTEAIAHGVPVLATRIPAAEGLLGNDHPGLFPVRDEKALCVLLQRCEQDPVFLEELRGLSNRLRDSVSPERESADLRALLAELTDNSHIAKAPRPLD